MLEIERFPNVEILIENRCGSVYHGGKFILSKVQDIGTLCEAIDQNSLQLKIAYDVPQIYTAHNAKTEEAYLRLLDDTKLDMELILLHVPAGTFALKKDNKTGLVVRADKPELIDLRIDLETFVERRGGLDFFKYVVKKIKY